MNVTLADGLSSEHFSSWQNVAHMITGAIKSQIDQIWNAFWSGGTPASRCSRTCAS